MPRPSPIATWGPPAPAEIAPAPAAAPAPGEACAWLGGQSIAPDMATIRADKDKDIVEVTGSKGERLVLARGLARSLADAAQVPSTTRKVCRGYNVNTTLRDGKTITNVRADYLLQDGDWLHCFLGGDHARSLPIRALFGWTTAGDAIYSLEPIMIDAITYGQFCTGWLEASRCSLPINLPAEQTISRVKANHAAWLLGHMPGTMCYHHLPAQGLPT